MPEPTEASATPIEAIAIVVPADLDALPPPMASHVRLAGLPQAIVLQMFHLGSYRLSRAAVQRELGVGMRVLDDTVLEVESTPVARVGMSPTLAIETAVSLLEAAFDQVASLQELGPEVQARFEALGTRMAGMSGK